MYQDVLNEIDDSDMVLVGIGNELAYHKTIDWNAHKKYSDWKLIFSTEDGKRKGEIQTFYQTLNQFIENKNYFIITINVDDLIYESGLNPSRITAPCGSKNRMQCRCADGEGIIEAPDNFYDSGGTLVCKKCGYAYTPNIYNTDYYNETGYLKQWNLYHKWLQGTLNKKLLILEFGCDFSLLSVLRLPFEKIAMINQKASYYRINNRFPQVTAELKNKMKSIACTPQEFAQKLKESNSCSIL